MRHIVRTGAIVLGILVGWQLIVMLFDIPAYMLPTPVEVFDVFREHARLLFSDTLATVFRAGLGLLLGAILAFVLAVGFVYSHRFQSTMLPIISATEAIPKIAFAPLIVLWLGIGWESKVCIAASIAFFPLVINLTRGLRDVDPDIISMTRVWEAAWWRVLFYVRFPNGLGAFFDGLRIAIPGALIGAILGEFISSNNGLGYRVLTANASLRIDVSIAAILCIAAVAIVSSQLITIAESRLMAWQKWNVE